MLGRRPFRRRRFVQPDVWLPCHPGDLVEIPGQGKAWRIISCTPDLTFVHPSGSGWRSEWPSTWAWRLQIERPDGSERGETTLAPEHARWVHENGVIIDDDGHFPVCSICGDIWPCWHSRFARESDAHLRILEEKLAWRATHPHPCGWCQRIGHTENRFKTARGLNAHVRQCEHNPMVWNLTMWVPFLQDNLHQVGGYSPQADPNSMIAMTRITGLVAGDAHVQRARRVIAAAAAVEGDAERMPACIDGCPEVA